MRTTPGQSWGTGRMRMSVPVEVGMIRDLANWEIWEKGGNKQNI